MGVGAGFEWPATLDVSALAAEGWTPVPFREFIVKIHSRCDLACDYCYVYEMADQSWRDRPRRMSAEIASLTAMRIGEHARPTTFPLSHWSYTAVNPCSRAATSFRIW